MESKQTAVEWLVKEVNSDCLNSTFIRKELIDQAKEMEKQQILIAYDNGWETGSYKPEQYYNETYGK
jgi:hypothetical protein